jgi:hypothetical protein
MSIFVGTGIREWNELGDYGKKLLLLLYNNKDTSFNSSQIRQEVWMYHYTPIAIDRLIACGVIDVNGSNRINRRVQINSKGLALMERVKANPNFNDFNNGFIEQCNAHRKLYLRTR